MADLVWKAVAWVVSRKPVADYIIKRAKRTPYFHLEDYMHRWWVFNPYGGNKDDPQADEFARHKARYRWFPSIRVHHILRADIADHPHDHPWNARTIILKGWYTEQRHVVNADGTTSYKAIRRRRGDTARIGYGEYHHVSKVSKGGVWTLFFTREYMGFWGFWKDGQKVRWQDYVAQGGRT
jgi:hypothetical protein